MQGWHKMWASPNRIGNAANIAPAAQGPQAEGETWGLECRLRVLCRSVTNKP